MGFRVLEHDTNPRSLWMNEIRSVCQRSPVLCQYPANGKGMAEDPVEQPRREPDVHSSSCCPCLELLPPGRNPGLRPFD